MSFKFIAVAYGMLGATAATGYYVQVGGGGGMGTGGAGRAANPPKAERVAKLEVPPMPEHPVAAPVPAPVAAPGPDTMLRAEVPAAATASVMPLTAPPTPPPPPASVATASASDGGFSRGYMQITADMTVNPWTGAWLTSDDRAMGYITGPVTAQSAPAPVMVAQAPEPVPPPPEPEAAQPPAVASAPDAAPDAVPSAVPVARAAVIDRTAEPAAEPRTEAPSGSGYLAHLASYRDQEHAMAGWKTLKKSHRDLLINRAPIMVKAEIPGQGTFVRLMTDGFTQLTDVSEFCTGLKATGQYCHPMKGK